MKRYILKLSFFLVFVLCFYALAIVLWGSFAPSVFKVNLHDSRSSSFVRLKEIRNVENPDILFLGSSHAYQGFDTRIFKKQGLNTFILGTIAQTPSQTLLLLNRYLDKINPQSVIFEVNPMVFMSDGVESSLDIIANDKNDVYSYEEVFKINNIKAYNTLIFAQFRDWVGLNKQYSKPASFIEGGFSEIKMSFYKPTKIEKKEIVLPQDQLDSFKKCVYEIEKRNIKLILVYAPISRNLYLSYTNNEYFDLEMKKYSEYYNFNEIISLTDSIHFRDEHHLNQNGVELFNKKLIETLKLFPHDPRL